MRCSVVGAVILLCLLQKCTAKVFKSPSAVYFLTQFRVKFIQAIDNLDFFANISQYVDYSDIEEEDKKYTLQKLITDTGKNIPFVFKYFQCETLFCHWLENISPKKLVSI